MTTEERLIISAYTGFLMVDVLTFRSWISDKGYPDPLKAITPLGARAAFDELQKQVKKDFITLCDSGEA